MFMDTVAVTLTSLLSGVADIFNSAVNMVTGNVVGAAVVGCSLAGIGIGLFRRIRH